MKDVVESAAVGMKVGVAHAALARRSSRAPMDFNNGQCYIAWPMARGMAYDLCMAYDPWHGLGPRACGLLWPTVAYGLMNFYILWHLPPPPRPLPPPTCD